MEKYYWIKHDGRITEISKEKYDYWTCIKQNNHKMLRITKTEIDYNENGLNLIVKKELMKRILELS